MRISDWSSDVCSSDLWAGDPVVAPADRRGVTPVCDPLTLTIAATTVAAVGKGYSALVQSAQARGVEAQARVNQREANASAIDALDRANQERSEEHTSELQSLMRISYAVFCLKNKNNTRRKNRRRKHINNNT